MTRTEFVSWLQDIRREFTWYEDELEMLRASHPLCQGELFTPLTALAYEQSGQVYCAMLCWEQAAQALGLSLADASAIVSAEDQDSQNDPELARALRVAVGIKHG